MHAGLVACSRDGSERFERFRDYDKLHMPSVRSLKTPMNRETREGEREEEGMDPERWKYTHTHTVDREEGMEKGSGRSEEGGGQRGGAQKGKTTWWRERETRKRRLEGRVEERQREKDIKKCRRCESE